jgi:hypothetical protein
MSMRTLSLSAAAVGLVTALFAATAPARAQPTADAEQACTPDVMRLCNEFVPERDKIVSCLRRKARALSTECRSALRGGGGKAKGKRRHRRG